MQVEYVEHEERDTSYRLLFTELPNDASEREGGQIAISLFSPNRSCYTFARTNTTGYLHWSYIMEKFGLGKVDAEIVAKIIMDTLPWFNE